MRALTPCERCFQLAHGIRDCCAEPCALYLGLLEQLEWLRTAPTDLIFRLHGIRDAVRSVGLQPSERQVTNGGSAVYNWSIYGDEAPYQLTMSPFKKNTALGMWQVPQQFECLLQNVRKVFDRPIRNSLTIGTWSGWTDLVTAAILRRINTSPGENADLHHATFDINPGSVTNCIHKLLAHHGIRQVRRGWYGDKQSWGNMGLAELFDGKYPSNFSTPILDYCLIDGGHGYRQVARDYLTLRTACHVIAFHDIVNVRGWEVPEFWSDITMNHEHKLFAHGFKTRHCTHQPRYGDNKLMGIGVLLRGEQSIVNSTFDLPMDFLLQHENRKRKG
mmetsp:Transcript_2163/g.3574  ORF Transcript_2163/g.3574 Transcript_2163/m.3574 type:complete len:332 (+) Transcript_2163:196-1191(+)